MNLDNEVAQKLIIIDYVIIGSDRDDSLTGTIYNHIINYGIAGSYNKIYDESGENDKINLTNRHKSDLHLFFDLSINSEGTIIKEDSKNLYVKSSLTTAETDITGIKVTDYFVSGHEIENITTADDYYATDSSINAIRQDVASWLFDNSYTSVDAAINAGEQGADISELVAIFDSAWSKGA